MENALSRAWKDNPEVIRNYYDNISAHQKLCDEVRYILEKKIALLGIEIGHLTSRAKTLESFCEKIERKKYKNPIEQITDISGVRIVYLYSSDRLKLEHLVEKEFEVQEKVDKFREHSVAQFGYGALHYVIKLKEQHAGARYDDLRNVRCEIQIRTILQDSWAIVAHHLSYKHEDDIPNELKRKLHALSGLFEIADDQFEGLNNARVEYQNKVAESIRSNSGLSLDAELNLDSLIAYITLKFPNRNPSTSEGASGLLEELHRFGYKTLRDVNTAVEKAWDAVHASEAKYPPTNMYDNEESTYVGVGMIRGSLEFINDEYFTFLNPHRSIDRREEFSHLIK